MSFAISRRKTSRYSFTFMPLLGQALAGSRQAYTHLPETIRLFPLPHELSAVLRGIGFGPVSYRRLTKASVGAIAISPDSQWIAFAQVRDSNSNGRSDRNDAVDIWAAPLAGGEPVPLVRSPHRDGDPTWTW